VDHVTTIECMRSIIYGMVLPLLLTEVIPLNMRTSEVKSPGFLRIDKGTSTGTSRAGRIGQTKDTVNLHSTEIYR
jgi:hypothetical protein